MTNFTKASFCGKQALNRLNDEHLFRFYLSAMIGFAQRGVQEVELEENVQAPKCIFEDVIGSCMEGCCAYCQHDYADCKKYLPEGSVGFNAGGYHDYD